MLLLLSASWLEPSELNLVGAPAIGLSEPPCAAGATAGFVTADFWFPTSASTRAVTLFDSPPGGETGMAPPGEVGMAADCETTERFRALARSVLLLSAKPPLAEGVLGAALVLLERLFLRAGSADAEPRRCRCFSRYASCTVLAAALSGRPFSCFCSPCSSEAIECTRRIACSHCNSTCKYAKAQRE